MICFYICAFKNLNALTIYIYNYLQDRSSTCELKTYKIHLKDVKYDVNCEMRELKI